MYSRWFYVEARVLRNLVEVVELIVNVQRLLDVTSQCHFDLRWGFERSNYNALLVFVIPFNVTLGFCDIVSVIHVNLIIRLVLNSIEHHDIAGDNQHGNGNNQIQNAKDRKQNDQILRFPRGTNGIESLLQELYSLVRIATPHGP